MQKGFWLGFTIFQSIILFYSLMFSKLNQILWINKSHTAFGDSLFQTISFLAEIAIPIFLLVYVLIKKRKYIYPLIISYIAVTIVVQLFKHQVYPDMARPILYFAKEKIQFYTIPGEIIHQRNSFPSGHTATAWWIVYWFSLLFAKNRIQFLWISSFAFGVALSRVYLLQHFPIDTFGGGLMGAFITHLTYYLYHQRSVRNKF